MRLAHLPLFVLPLAGCTEYEILKGEPPGDEGLVDTAWAVDAPEDTPPPEEVTETFDLTDEAGADLLFFGDTSGSMAVELTTMGDQIAEVIASVSAVTDQWQLLAVTGPSGCGVGGVLTPDTPDYESVFSAGLLTPPGEDLVDEWGLYNAAMAIDQTDEGECNAGFMRADARLYIVFISDEDDNSPGYDSGDPNYWQTYVDAIRAKKGDASKVTFSAVIGPEPDGCDGAEPGIGYEEAVAATEGVQLSICEDWYAHVAELVDLTEEQTTFPLSDRPVTDSLAVKVNSLPRSTGWSFDASINAVVFSANIPVTGNIVEITYTLAE